MTGNQHTDHISYGQRVSRNSLPTLLYFLFSPPHIFFNSILCRPVPKAFGSTLALAPTARHVPPMREANPSGKSQRAVSANALTENSVNKTDFLRILTN